MPKSEIDYGPVIVDGRLRRTSVSMVEKADTARQGCLRSLFFRYVLRWKEPPKLDKYGRPIKQGKDLGGECHNEIQHFLTTGESVLGRIAGAAKRYMPEPKAHGVYVEQAIGGNAPDLSGALLEIEGVPLVGYIDILDTRGRYLDDSGQIFDDPPNTVEILDWKFGSAKIGGKAVCYAKTANDLRVDTQMMTYGLVPLSRHRTEHARLSHVYTNTEGAPASSKVSTLVTYDDVAAFSARTAAIVRVIKDVVAETDPEKVPGNSFACTAFGGCPWMENCSHWKQTGGLASYYGTSELETLLEGKINMGLLDGISLPGMTASPAGVAAVIPLVPAGAHDVLSQITQIARPAFTPAQPTPEFSAATMVIEQKGYGMVGLTGAAAQMYLAFRGDRRPITFESTVPGYGILGTKTVDDPLLVIGISKDIAAHPINPKPDVRPEGQLALHSAAPAVLGILPASAPQSNPALAADPVPGFNALTPSVQVPGLLASVPATTSAAVIAQTAAPASPMADLPPAAPTKRKYTRRAKVDGSQDDPPSGDSSWLFVGARPNINVIDLSGWITKLCDDLVRHHKLIIPDVRTAKGDHPLAFQAWKGHVTAYARAAAADLEPGAYYLRVGTNDLNECVLDGLRAAKRRNADKTESTDPVFELVVFGES